MDIPEIKTALFTESQERIYGRKPFERSIGESGKERRNLSSPIFKKSIDWQ
jgi:hypothetical protein